METAQNASTMSEIVERYKGSAIEIVNIGIHLPWSAGEPREYTMQEQGGGIQCKPELN